MTKGRRGGKGRGMGRRGKRKETRMGIGKESGRGARNRRRGKR